MIALGIVVVVAAASRLGGGGLSWWEIACATVAIIAGLVLARIGQLDRRRRARARARRELVRAIHRARS